MKEFFSCGNPFMWIAIVCAVFYGVGVTWAHRCSVWQQAKIVWWIYQVWFNALGTFIGWIAVCYLWSVPFKEFELKHLIALVVAYLGITGNLPQVSLRQKPPGG